ncbi:MAG: C4-dicarboxylate transporter DctA [Verrucomicrobiota bacterium]
MKWISRFKPLHMQVLLGVILGCVFGLVSPASAVHYKPVADAFVKLISMLISPIIFCTIVVGIGSMNDLKRIGRVGFVALLYFEVVTTLALVIGLVVVNWIKPGVGMHANAATLDVSSIAMYTTAAKKLSVLDYLMNLIPTTLPGALVSGEILQVVLVAILVGVALASIGEKGKKLTELLEIISKVMMAIVGMVVRLAPLAAFAAIAFVVGKYGSRSLLSLASLMLCVIVTMALFIIFVLGGILRLNKFRLWPLIKYLKEEILLVLGTSSSETALPGLMAKMEGLGCAKPVVGLVVPAGYSFNLDGTSIYLTMAAVFIAQATDTPLTLWQQIVMLFVLMLASKGAAAVTGGGFVTLSATLASTQTVPVAGLTLVLGIDRFMSLARAMVNLIGNAVAVLAIASWENAIDRDQANRVLNTEPITEEVAPFSD